MLVSLNTVLWSSSPRLLFLPAGSHSCLFAVGTSHPFAVANNKCFLTSRFPWLNSKLYRNLELVRNEKGTKGEVPVSPPHQMQGLRGLNNM